MCYVHAQVSKLKTAATSVKSLVSKIDGLKHQAKSLDEVIQALKWKSLLHMMIKRWSLWIPLTKRTQLLRKVASANTSNNLSIEVVTMATTTITTVDTTFSLATTESETGPGDDVA